MAYEARVPSPEAQLAGFFAQYDAPIAKLGKALRTKLRARLPGLRELVYVYENQGLLVLSYSPTENGVDGVSALALYPDCVKLFFGQGAQLSKSDPKKLLQGSGKTVRFVAMDTAADFDRAEIQALMAAAVKLAKVRLDPGAKGATIVKAEAQTQRAVRAAKKARPAPAPRKAKARR